MHLIKWRERQCRESWGIPAPKKPPDPNLELGVGGHTEEEREMAKHREVEEKCNYQEKALGTEKGAPNSGLWSRNRLQRQRGIRTKRKDTSSALPHHLSCNSCDPQREQSRHKAAVEKGITQWSSSRSKAPSSPCHFCAAVETYVLSSLRQPPCPGQTVHHAQQAGGRGDGSRVAGRRRSQKDTSLGTLHIFQRKKNSGGNPVNQKHRPVNQTSAKVCCSLLSKSSSSFWLRFSSLPCAVYMPRHTIGLPLGSPELETLLTLSSQVPWTIAYTIPLFLSPLLVSDYLTIAMYLFSQTCVIQPY